MSFNCRFAGFFALCALVCAGCSTGKSSVTVQTSTFEGNTDGVAAVQQPAEENVVSLRQYTTQKNDSLWKLAKKFYGDGNQWGRIFEANMGVIKSPDLLEPGTKIIIPD